jgi:hypothetical protein
MTVHELNLKVSDLLQFSVPRPILEMALEGFDSLQNLEEEDIDALCTDCLERCQAFDADLAWRGVLGSRTAEMVAREFNLTSDEVDLWLHEQEREAVKYGLALDFSSMRAQEWHADVVQLIQSHC